MDQLRKKRHQYYVVFSFDSFLEALVGFAVFFSIETHIANHLRINLWVPLTFLTYHAAFGWGMLCGVFRFLGRRGPRRHRIPRMTSRR